jgi:hypothetical protein
MMSQLWSVNNKNGPMHKLIYLILFLSLVVASVSCKKETDLVDPTPSGETPGPSTPSPTGGFTPVGTPAGPVVTATIGPAGGQVETADQRIRIEIPAGALTTNQTISVQPLDTNYCPGGTGLAFRLLPHGLTFARPATITFQYEDQDVEGSTPEFLRIAYQNDHGSWQSPVTERIDTTAKTLTIRTTHFSDWALLQNIKIVPFQAAIDPGSHVELKVFQFARETDDESASIMDFRPLEDKSIKKWILQGDGSLQQQGTYVATYYAPDKIPATNPVNVSVLVSANVKNVPKEIRLTAKIYVFGEGLVFRINKGPWIPTTSVLGLSKTTTSKGAYFTVQTNSVIQGLFATATLSWPATRSQEIHTKEYSLPWRLQTSDNWKDIPTLMISTNPTGQPLYTFFYEENKIAHPSPGELRIIQTPQSIGHDVVGSFTMKKAGIVHYTGGTDPLFDGTAEVEGYFRLKYARDF